jgi:hypothetical protein
MTKENDVNDTVNILSEHYRPAWKQYRHAWEMQGKRRVQAVAGTSRTHA